MVATFEAAKGLMVLVAGFGLFELMHGDVQAGAERLVRHLNLNPASHYPRVFIDASVWFNDAHLRMLAFGAVLYAAVRFVEAFGLWRARRWAEWFGAVSGGIYLPLEIYKLWEAVTWPRVTLLTVNGIIVVYLVQFLARARSGPTKVDAPPAVMAAP